MRKRKLPRPFTMHWGGGLIVEEASVESPHHVPTIQLLEYTDGEAAGSVSVRFCFFSHDGRFQRSPLMMDEEAIDAMRGALKQTPRLRALIARMVDEPSP
ncbi:MAG: hypothetical protein Kow0010_07670 [Dehalococcoidia bacterium]